MRVTEVDKGEGVRKTTTYPNSKLIPPTTNTKSQESPNKIPRIPIQITADPHTAHSAPPKSPAEHPSIPDTHPDQNTPPTKKPDADCT